MVRQYLCNRSTDVKEGAIGYAVGTLPQRPGLLGRLLARGDAVSIERGVLVIAPASGKCVPPNWLSDNGDMLVRQILGVTGQDAYRYQGHKTGHYGPHRSAGLTLQFQSVMTDDEAYAIFNTELTRARNTASGKKGDPLPAGQFRAASGSHLMKFWQTTGIALKRLAAMHDYIGRLRNVLISASPTRGRDDGRLDAGSLRVLNISSALIRQAMELDKQPTKTEQATDKPRTRRPYKDITQAQHSCGVQPVMTARENQYGNKVIRERGNTGTIEAIHSRKLPQEQSVDEWLADFDSVI
ncbi:hypothetical protein PSOLE_37430 [Pseudomonas oleovorans subsp. oleovorans]|uniref:Uncharacterized protein n=1 Tax=Ectopseudomonas oleovorans TaxID=301 RepID=A0A379PJA5_ECTOL|nr:hypothetical protein [Pseudomonas oleovorans]OWK40710.1 hypothetical protein PSOLE_37430 [Pseudomonas oleovorans subsp. oleovorans]SEJ91765.1 hypothetical protein SAMN05216280_10642 [Pseudomonas oleovorans]SUE72727.1 Uncharacterised protein [Pseudomonas oleovorans]